MLWKGTHLGVGGEATPDDVAPVEVAVNEVVSATHAICISNLDRQRCWGHRLLCRLVQALFKTVSATHSSPSTIRIENKSLSRKSKRCHCCDCKVFRQLVYALFKKQNRVFRNRGSRGRDLRNIFMTAENTASARRELACLVS